LFSPPTRPIESRRQALAAVHRRRQRHVGRSVDRIVDFGEEAPLHVLGDSRALLLFLDVLKKTKLGRGLVRAIQLAVEPIKLKVRRGEPRVQIACRFELFHGGCLVALRLQDGAYLVMRHRFVGHQLHHALELRERSLQVTLFLERDSQVEPRVRQLGVGLLGLLQLGDSLGRLACAQQRQPVIDLLARGIGGQGQRFFELVDGLLLCRGVFVKGLAEIAVVPEVGLIGPARLCQEHPGHTAGRQRGNQGTSFEHTSEYGLECSQDITGETRIAIVGKY